MREIIVSATVLDKLSDLVSYLKNDIRLSEDAAQAYRKRFIAYIQTVFVFCKYNEFHTGSNMSR